MGLNKEQQAAVEHIDGPLLVLAGPGTGKTHLLSNKVEYILKNTDTNPENILCVTFTESGASNMRERLLSLIGPDAHKIKIYTYHAFGSDILKQFQNFTEVAERQLDNAIDEVRQQKILREIQAELPVRDILKKADIAQVKGVISSAKSYRLSSTDLKEIAEENIKISEILNEEINPILQKLAGLRKTPDKIEEVYRPIMEVLAQHIVPLDRDDNLWARTRIEPIPNVYLRELHQIFDEVESAEKPSVKPLSKWKTDRFVLDNEGNFRLKDWLANKRLLSFAEIMAKYDECLRRDGLFDFADMIEEAIRALKEHDDFRMSMQERLQYIMLDEFQDTNPSQFELIKLLTEAEKPNIMAVGDDDQAIYEFQGANASNLIEFQRYYKAQVITLIDNYRSKGDILGFSHQVAEQIDGRFSKIHQINKKLRSIKDTAETAEKSQVALERHEFTAAPDEYYWISQKIARLINDGVRPKDIAVIAPKHKFLSGLLPYLKHENIAIEYEKKSNILEEQKIYELLTLARFVQELADEAQPSHRWLEILSFSFWGLAPEDVIRATCNDRRKAKATLDYLLESDNERLQNIAKMIAQFVAVASTAPLELMLDYLIGRQKIAQTRANISIIAQNDEKVNSKVEVVKFCSPFFTYYDQILTSEDKLEFFENLNRLSRIVKEQIQSEKPKLKDLIMLLDDYELANASITSESVFRDSADAVQLMSAHKSKGLEFEHVFLISVDNYAWGAGKGNNDRLSLPANMKVIRHTGVTDDERLRLLFVAITRAKRYLYMTNSQTNYNDKKVDRLSYLVEQTSEDGQIISSYLPERFAKVATHYDDFDVETRLNALEDGWVAHYFKLNPNLREILKARMENHYFSATELTQFIDIIYAGPTAVYQNTILQAPREPETQALAYGSLLHKVFERITRDNIADEEALRIFEEEALNYPLPEREISDLIETGHYALSIALTTFRDIIRHPNAKAEVNFKAEHLNLDGVPLTGKIDHINIDHDTKTIEVYDFKTSKHHPEKWASVPTLYKYALQLGFYKLLLNLSPTYSKYKVTKGHILFVNPDDEGIVYDKVYEYNEQDEEELKQLIKNVYRQITTLEFLDNDEINIAPDKSRNMKDLRAFVAKILELR